MGARILLVEKDRTLRRQVASILEGAGFEVTTAADARQGLRKYSESRSDLVIMAEAMAGEEELCSRLRQVAYLPIIVLGAEGGGREAEMLSLGVDAYVAQPTDVRGLVARVRSLLRRSEREV